MALSGAAVALSIFSFGEHITDMSVTIETQQYLHFGTQWKYV
jgi:hypothetical protein